MYTSKVATAASAPRADEHPSHIHALSPHDAAVLSACAEFSTFPDAVAKVVHVVLPILEQEVWRTCVGGSPAPVGDETASSVHWVCCSDAVEVAVSLPTFAWDAERRLPLPPSTRLSSDHHDAAPQPRRKIHRGEGVTAAVPRSPRLQAALDLLQRLAAVCADVCVAVWIASPSQRHCRASCDAGPSAGRMCIEGRWHSGQAVHTAGSGGEWMGKAWQAAADSPHAHLVTRCSVRGLFDNLPLRQSAFAYAEAGSRTAAWAAVSASAQRARRDAQTHLLTVLFHAALCTVLAPLYLAGPSHEACHAAALTFTARLYTDGGRRLREGNIAAVGVVPPLSLTNAADTCDDSAVAGQPAHRGTLAGLACDRYGLRRGCVVVTAARGRCPPSLRAEVRRETRGEQTSRELCYIFGVVAPPPHLSQKHSGAQHDHLPVFTEAVVLPGEFAVVFHTPPLDPSVFIPRAALSPSLHRPSARRSAHFTFAAPDHQTSASCVIVVARRGGLVASPPQPSLPSYSVLDSGHWAYDVVAAEARGGRRCGGTSARPVPVFVFVDARHVPAHLHGSQPVDSQGEGCTARRKGSLATFREMLKLAVAQLSSANQVTAVASGVDARAHPAGAPPPPSSSPSPPVGTLSVPAVNASVALPPSLESGNAAVGLRMHFVLQRVLEAAAATGTPSCMPIAPPARAGAGAAPLHRVRVTANALRQSAIGGSTALEASLVAVPRRTPVSLHPKLSAVVAEERESEGRLRRVAAGVGEGMARVRHLLDTGRGSVLRQLPRACGPPQSWSPATAASGGAAVAGPPIGLGTAGVVAVVPWARKFILLAHAASSGFSAGHPTRSSEERRALPSPHSRSHLCQRRWWLLDQHAVHERARLEFFLCFADTYVVHPELRSTPARCPPVCAASPLCREAQQALRRRHQHTRLLSHLSQNSGGARHSPSRAEFFTDASPTFPVVIPPEWRIRVGAVAAHLLLWGWRFAYGMVPSGTLLSLPTTVLSWPCVSVEGVVRCFTSLSVLTDTVEELEALGGAASAPSPLHIVPAVVLRFLVSRSCRGAVMFGDAVTAAAARQVVAALGCVEQYYVCSHGRASFATLVPLTTQ